MSAAVGTGEVSVPCRQAAPGIMDTLVSACFQVPKGQTVDTY